MSKFTVTAISDTHGQVTLPELLKDYESDILIHCGDFTAGRTNHLSTSVIYESHARSWQKFLYELSVIRCQFKTIIVVPGNHDQICEVMPAQCKSEMEEIGIHLLINDGLTLFDGKENGEIKAWGIPHTTPFGAWFFQGYKMSTYTNKIPIETDLLISHGPPYSILDTVGPVSPQDICPGDYLGSKDLYTRCQELPELKAVFFGHIHSSHGEDREQEVSYFNCSVLDERYQWRYSPITTKIQIDEGL